jgi:large subunit ribosomal protein L28
MSQKCNITNKVLQFGHKVSHSNRKSKRKFLPNLQTVTFLSDRLGKVSFRASVNAIRTVESKDGIDNYLLKTSTTKLPEQAAKLKLRLKKALAKKVQA